ncbi:MAG: DEAD/DEAH box helicase [Deltaproteobacteria bacterium]|nr:DEAD/DEAH box helicase [Deltaproteobacteria bacterium]
MRSFAEFDLLPSLQATLAGQDLVTPTDIQARALPALLGGRSLVAVAETGSGKTLTYVLPILHRLKRLEDEGQPVETPAQPRAVVLVPTRELGEQVSKVFKTFTHETRLRVRSVLGGSSAEIARRNVTGIFEVLVATPGRLVQLLDQGVVSLSDVRVLVLDEADQLVDLGFLPAAGRIVQLAPAKRQLAMFSATIPPAVEALIAKSFSEPLVIRSEGSHKTVASLTTVNREVKDGKRFPVLESILAEETKGGTLIFANTREQCDKVVAELRAAGRECAVYRGEMDKAERRANLQAFRDGTIPLLVTTDLGSRGLDVAHVARVVNYHMPQSLASYLHRVGRTARAGRAGVVINLVTPRDEGLVKQLRRIRR